MTKELDALVRSPLHVVRHRYGINGFVSDNSLKPLTFREWTAYFARNGPFPKQPRLILDLSGGCAKGYIITGLMIRFYTAGVDFDEASLVSVVNFVPVLDKTRDVKQFREFSLEIPELIEPRSSTAPGKFVDVTLYHGKSHFGNGQPVSTHLGLYKTDKLEVRLKEIYGNDTTGQFYPRYHMLAMVIKDEKTWGIADLGADYPQMPMVTASIGTISIPSVFPFVPYNGALFQDVGYVKNFPFEREHLDRADVVIAVDLGYNAKCPSKPNYGGIEGIFINNQVQAETRERERTERLAYEMAGVADLSSKTWAYGPKVVMAFPETTDIPPGEIRIPFKRREELIAQGEALGEEILKSLRKPMVSFYVPFLNRRKQPLKI
ncbi:hypothetical protein HY487_00725 [Candidatus Woesearchaeota archaeon]|nr:hypothetical protein [Candidatus Woesearchaeota archaeon]